MNGLRTAGLLGLLLLLTVTSAGRELVSFEDAVMRVFGDSLAIEEEYFILDDAEVKQITRATGIKIEDRFVTLFKISRGGDVLGFAMRCEGQGRYHPFSYLVGVDDTGRVRGVVLLEYSSPHGSEIGNDRFVKRFLNRSVDDPSGRDRKIDAISGATLSSTSMIEGVDRGLWVIEMLLRR